jgi:competence protein ComEA
LPETARIFPSRGAVDSDKTFVPEKQEVSRPEIKGTLVSINQAGWEDLSGLSGIGPVLARRIVDYRIQNGPFIKIEDLLKVQGIGLKKLETIRAYITLHEPGEVQDINDKI